MARILDSPARDSGAGGTPGPDDGASHAPGPDNSAGGPMPRRRPFRILKELEPPFGVFRDLGPNWFAAVMGTGIVANAGASLPLRVPGLRGFATVVWGLAAAALIALAAAWTVHWIRYPERARGHARHPVMAQFWGAPPMALTTVGTGTLVLGRGLLGTGAAVGADWVLWGAGTVLPAPYAAGAAVFALLYGVPAWGFAMAWLALAAAITLRTARRAPHGLPFALTWWSFTFPVGTCVTGTIALADRSHAGALRGASVALYTLLLVAWLVVAARTAHGAATGRLLRPMAPASPKSQKDPKGPEGPEGPRRAPKTPS